MDAKEVISRPCRPIEIGISTIYLKKLHHKNTKTPFPVSSSHELSFRLIGVLALQEYFDLLQNRAPPLIRIDRREKVVEINNFSIYIIPKSFISQQSYSE